MPSFSSVIPFFSLPNTCTSSSILPTPLHFLYAWWLSLSKMSWPVLYPKGILRSLHLCQRCVEGYYEWWCCIKLQIVSFCFGPYFEWKILELYTFVNNCIFSYYNIVSPYSAYRFINYALLSKGILLFSLNSTDITTLCGVCIFGLLASNSMWYSKSLKSPLPSKHPEYVHFVCSSLLTCGFISRSAFGLI